MYRVNNNRQAWVDSVFPKYQALTKTLEPLIEVLLSHSQIEFLSVSSRTKTRSGILEKIRRKNYLEPESQLTDICGVRIITFLESGVSAASEVIRNNFTVDSSNSLDKSQLLGVDRFGYRSVHFVCSLTDDRLKLPEFQDFSALTFEVQIRTVLQHAWAELAHDRHYKFSGVLPGAITRRLNLYAGMLELVDDGFQALAEEMDAYSNTVEKKASSGDLKLELTSSALLAYIILLVMNKDLPVVTSQQFFYGEEHLISELQAFGLKSIEDIDNLMTDEYISQFKNANETTNPMGFLRNAMMYSDIDKYFNDAWKHSWEVAFRDNLKTLFAKYGEDVVLDKLQQRGIEIDESSIPFP